MARTTKPKPPSATTVILVRHGQTPTTGTNAARAGPPACTWPTRASSRPRRPPPGSPSSTRSPRSTPRRSSAPARRRPPSPRPSACGSAPTAACSRPTSATGPARKLADLGKLPEWKTVQRYPSGFRFPGGESFTEMQVRITSTLARLAEQHRGETIVAVSHADPIKAALADALGTHLDLFQRIVVSPCSVSVIWYADDRPGRAHLQQHRRRPHHAGPVCMTSSFDFDAPDHFTAGAVGPPGQRVFFLQARQDGEVANLRLEKQQVAALGRLPRRHPRRPARRRASSRTDVELIEPAIEEWVVGALAVAYEEADDRVLLVAEELVLEPTRTTRELAADSARRPGHRPVPPHPRPGPGLHPPRRRARHLGPTAVPAVRPSPSTPTATRALA